MQQAMRAIAPGPVAPRFARQNRCFVQMLLAPASAGYLRPPHL
jgi:hypothetical protein